MRNPYDSALPTLFAEYPATSEIGRHVRRADAQLQLKAMADAEQGVQQQEELNRQIADRLARMRAEHELAMQYLVQFGVTANERETFRSILEEIAQHGGLDLRQAANLAHARHETENIDSAE